MKRSRIIPELVDPPRRKRALSEEERALWDSVAKQTKPLRKKPRLAKAAVEGAAERLAAKAVTPPPPAPAKTMRPVKLQPSPPPPPLAPLGRRERSQLSRGRKEIDARLDLHGMTQTRAHRVLSDFLHRAHADGLTFVLVITGKGRTTAHEFGTRRAAPPGAAMARPTGISHPGGGIRGSPYRPWRRRRALRADPAVKNLSRLERPHDSDARN